MFQSSDSTAVAPPYNLTNIMQLIRAGVPDWRKLLTAGAKLVGLNLANSATVAHRVMYYSGIAFLGLRTFDENKFNTELGGLDGRKFYQAPNTAILAFTGMTVFAATPLWRLFWPSGGEGSFEELKSMIEDVVRHVASIGFIFYFTGLYDAPPVVRYVLTVLVATPFIILLFAALSIRYTPANITAYLSRIRDWIRSDARYQTWIRSTIVAQGIAAGVAAAINIYNSSQEVNYAHEPQLVAGLAIGGFFASVLAELIKYTRESTTFSTLLMMLGEFGMGIFYMTYYVIAFRVVQNPQILMPAGFIAEQAEFYSIIAALALGEVAAVAVNGEEGILPRLTLTKPNYPRWAEVKDNAFLALYSFLCYLLHSIGLTVSWDQAQAPVLEQFGRLPAASALPSLQERLLDEEDGL